MKHEGRPTVSVVVAASSAADCILGCLEGVESAMAGHSGEVIVVDDSRDAAPELVARHFPSVRCISASSGRLVPHLWEIGIRQARGDIVAITTGHFVPADDWISEILKAHESSRAGVGGAIENAAGEGVISWAIYFCRYGRYMPPFECAPVADFAADNASYKRAILDRYEGTRRNGFWEAAIHERMQQDGMELMLTPAIRVRHRKSFSFFGFARQRFLHGREYACERASRIRPAQRVVRVMVSPAVPLVLLARTAGRVFDKRKNRIRFLTALPAMIAFFSAWAFGELAGYMSSPIVVESMPAPARPRV